MAGRKHKRLRSSLAQLWRLTEADQRRGLSILVLLIVIGAFADVVTIGMVVPFLTLLAAGPDGPTASWISPMLRAIGVQTSGRQLLAIAILLCAAAVAAGALRIVLTRKMRDFTATFGHRLSVEVQRRMLLQPYAWHVQHNSSEQLAAIEKAEQVTMGVVLPLVQTVAASVVGIFVLAVLLKLAPEATVVAIIILGGIYFGLGVAARKRLNGYARRLDEAYARRIKIVQEGLGGIRDVILDGMQRRVVEDFRAADGQLARAQADFAYIAVVPRFVIESVGIVVIVLLALFLSRREGGLGAALPVLGALALGAQRLLPVMQQLYDGWAKVLGNSAVVDDVVRRLSLPVTAAAENGAPLAFLNTIEFRAVGYSYADRAHPAVERLNFEIRRGTRVALVGATGSGKTTTADLLMGLLEPSSGEILVDGVALTDLTRQSWQTNVAHVPQMLFLADATIAQNVAAGRELDMNRVREAVAMAQLDEFVAGLPEGLETRVGERGVQVSGGQRQRLAIARAIYKNSPLLVFDEATSALDSATEAAILGVIEGLQRQGRTILIVAHRASTTEGCDQVLKLENGRLVEDTPAGG
jgi:ABC-type multidrug transport system fused ATPase/permease subunit